LLEETTSEEHPENLVWINLLLELTLAEAATASTGRLHISRFLPSLVIYPTLLTVRQARIRRADLLEGLAGLWRTVLIRMQLDSVLSICFFHVFLGGTSGHSQDIVIVLLRQDFLTYLDLGRCVLWSGGLLRLRCRLCLLARTRTLRLLLLLLGVPPPHRVEFVE
jgi:hypothetical protein